MPVNVRELVLNIEAKGKENNSKPSKVVQSGGNAMSKMDKEIIIREAVKRAMQEFEYKMGR